MFAAHPAGESEVERDPLWVIVRLGGGEVEVAFLDLGGLGGGRVVVQVVVVGLEVE